MGSRFVDELSRHMLDFKTKHNGVASELFDLAVDVIHIVRKAFAEIHHPLVRPIVRYVNVSEYDHASDIE